MGRGHRNWWELQEKSYEQMYEAVEHRDQTLEWRYQSNEEEQWIRTSRLRIKICTGKHANSIWLSESEWAVTAGIQIEP